MQYFALFHVPPNIRSKTINRHNIYLSTAINFCIISSPHQIPICCSIFVFKLYHKTCEQFYRNFGLYEKSPNSFLPGLPRSIINQFRFHNLLCLCLASVHLPHPFHLVFGFQLLGHAVLLCQLTGTISSMRFRAASSISAQYCLTYTQLYPGCVFYNSAFFTRAMRVFFLSSGKNAASAA